MKYPKYSIVKNDCFFNTCDVDLSMCNKIEYRFKDDKLNKITLTDVNINVTDFDLL
jgi:hypothetical protein